MVDRPPAIRAESDMEGLRRRCRAARWGMTPWKVDIDWVESVSRLVDLVRIFDREQHSSRDLLTILTDIHDALIELEALQP